MNEMLLQAEQKWKSYPEYIDSGIDWLGKIPINWKILPIKGFCRKREENNHPELPLLSVYRDYGVLYFDSRDDNHNRPALDLSTYKVVKKGDLVLNKMKTWQGSLAVSELEGIVSPAYIICKMTSFVYPRYIHHLLRSKQYINQYSRYSYGVRVDQWDLRFDDFKQIETIIPPYIEQQKIAKFIDNNLSEIDNLILSKQRLIELLQEKRTALISHAVTSGLDPSVPMKDSGVEWIGNIPAHWELTRLKFLAEVRQGVTKGRDLEGRDTIELPYLRVANVQDGYLDLSDMANILIGKDELVRYSLKVDDILMNEGGDYDKLGRGAVWKGEIEPCLHQNHVFAVRPSDKSLSQWINTITLTSYAKFYFMSKSKQSTNLASISGSNVKELPVILPPKNELEQIVNYIESTSNSIDNLIGKIEEGIGLLGEYRTSLISAAVTGKIDVRGEA